MARIVKIVHLYANELNLYGDAGNLLCLQYRMTQRHIPWEISTVGIGDRLGDFDILFVGGGQDREMSIIAPDLRKKSESLRYAIDADKVVLAICGGYQLLGEYYEDSAGHRLELSSCLPFYTVADSRRMIGNIVIDTPFGKVVGFENHSGRTYLSPQLQPLGRVLYGYGNDGRSGQEGVLYRNTFCTYCHGPVLPKNPHLADQIISRAVGTELEPIDDELELLCHNYLINLYR